MGGNTEPAAQLPWEAYDKDSRGIIWIEPEDTIEIYNYELVPGRKMSI